MAFLPDWIPALDAPNPRGLLPFESSRKFLFPIENEGRDLFDEMGGGDNL